MILVEKEIHVDGVDFRSASGLHRAQVRIAANLGFLETAFLVERGVDNFAAHDVAFLFDSRAAGEGEFQCFVFKGALSGSDHNRACARSFCSAHLRLDFDRDVFLQDEEFGVLFDDGAG